MTTNFNIEPYYDDYSKYSNFYRILFRPSYSIQARELTQMQSILQDQVTRMGNHLFKNGTMVIPGELSIDTEMHYVKLEPTYASIAVSTYIDKLVGKIVVCNTTGIRAQIVTVAAISGTDPDTLFVKYLDSGTDNSKGFADGSTITPEDPLFASMVVQSKSVNSTGLGSIASIKEGVYYINGYFVLVEPQVLILDKYINTPTYSVGFNIVESIVTPEQDETLLDNAQGSFNFAAPGAHRYAIYLQLVKKAADYAGDAADTDKYIQLVGLINGQAQNVYNQTQYAELAKVMARRTYDESGDYVVRDFKYEIREHRNNARGAWKTATAYLEGDIVVFNNKTYEALNNGTSGPGYGAWPSSEMSTFNDNGGSGGVNWRFKAVPRYTNGVYTPEQGGVEDYFAIALESGKAYVRGYEVEKVATTYVVVPKPRTTQQVDLAHFNLTVGNYALVTGIHGLPEIHKFSTVNLYNTLVTTGGVAPTGTLVGTARVRLFEFDSGDITLSTAIWKLSLFDIRMKTGYDFARDVKGMYSPTTPTAASTTDFTANIAAQTSALTGALTVTGTAATGVGISFKGLKVNDIISAGGNLYTVTAIASEIAMTVTAGGNITNLPFSLVTTKIWEPDNSSLLYFVHDYVSSMRNSSGLNTISYTTTQVLSGTVSSNLVSWTLGANQFASSAAVGNYLLTYGNGIVKSLTTWNGTTGEVEINNTGTTCTLHLSALALANGTTVTLYATVDKAGSINTEKQKAMAFQEFVVTDKAIGTARNIVTTKANGRSLRSVLMDTGTWAVPTGVYSIDITNRYTYSTGESDSFVNLAQVILQDGQIAPTAPIKIIHSYWASSGDGDYYTKDSFSNVSYSNLPGSFGMSLGDCLDFRPRIADNGLNFIDSGSSLAALPKRGYPIRGSYRFYQGRIDKLCIEPSGDFHLINGIPAEYPVPPDTTSTGMLLNTINLSPYGLATNEVTVQSVDNRRYTMKDIGKLEKRIENLEYYTTLSMAEMSTTNMDIVDSNGLSRFKNGFMVDSFNGHGVGNTETPEYRCSIDFENKTLRSFVVMKHNQLLLSDTTPNNYQITGDLITLPYTHKAMITQPFASAFENVNPFAVYSWLGSLSVNPEIDNWFETSRLPDVVVNVEGNYNSVLNQLSTSGQLGTVYNAWQTTWTGNPEVKGTVSSSTTSGGVKYQSGTNRVVVSRGSYGTTYTNVPVYSKTAVTTTTNTVMAYAKDTTQQRSIVTTSVGTSYSKALSSDRVVNTAVIPYMRSRNVVFIAEGLKSNTTMYATFDNVDVNAYVTPATRLMLNDVVGFYNTYETSVPAGVNATNSARVIGLNLDLSLNRGYILKGQTSGATAVVLYQEPRATTSTFTTVYVANVKGTFALNEVIIGSLDGGITGPRGTVRAVPTVAVKGNPLTTNYAGTVCGIFNIPSSDSLKFRTGTRELVLKDSMLLYPSTSCYTNYTSSGTIDYWQSTYTSTRNAVVSSTSVNDTRTLTDTWSTTKTSSEITTPAVITPTTPVKTTKCNYKDPLAQTFLVDIAGGVFITKVDLFFFSKETSLGTPVSIEIREVVNGIPGNNVAPFSVVYKAPENVNVSPTGTIPTTFAFRSPVYLQDGREYALVVLSDSNNYKVAISQMGYPDIATGKVISTQPTLGVLFKSSNGTTWTPDQMQDLKFTMYRAEFNTGVTGYVTFANEPVHSSVLLTDPIHTYTDQAIVRVSHPDHQMPAGSKVTIANVTTAIGGIPATELNGTHVISNVDQDSYTFTTTTVATSTMPGGGEGITATENIQFNTVQVNTRELVFQNTSVTYDIKTTSGKSTDGVETPYTKDGTWNSLVPNHNIDYQTPRMIASDVNEATVGANGLSGAKSMELRATLKSNQSSVSPVLDTQQLNVILVNNKLNAPTLANTNVSALDDRAVLVAVASKIGFDATLNSVYTALTNVAEVAALKTLSIGKYINIVSSGVTLNSGDHLVFDTRNDGTNYHVILAEPVTTEAVSVNAITITSHDRYVSEIAPQWGVTYNKYLTKEIILAQPSTFLKIKVAQSIPIEGNIDVYYRINQVGGTDPMHSMKWIYATPSKPQTKSAKDVFIDVDYNIQGLPSFDSVQVKIVMGSTSTSQVPMCKDLRIIACA